MQTPNFQTTLPLNTDWFVTSKVSVISASTTLEFVEDNELPNNQLACLEMLLYHSQEAVATVAGDGSGDGHEKALTVFMCEECNSVFLNQDTLAVHILAEHMPKESNLSAGSFVHNYIQGLHTVEIEESNDGKFTVFDCADSKFTRNFCGSFGRNVARLRCL